MKNRRSFLPTLSGNTTAGACLLMLATLTQAHAATFKLEEATIDQIHKAMEAGALSSVELNTMYLNRIAVYDQNGLTLNSIGVVNAAVMKDAALADDARKLTAPRPALLGIPIIIKESFDLKGLPTTNGLSKFLPLIAKRDSFATAKLKEAGAVIIAKGNMDAAQEGDGTEVYLPSGVSYPAPPISAYGFNPWGSSFGNAVAISANFGSASVAAETGLSIRAPSNNCSLVGLKPSYGLISLRGAFPNGILVDVIGPITRNSRDAALLMDAMVADDPANGFKDYFPSPSTLRPASYLSAMDPNILAGKKIGMPKPYIGGDPVNDPDGALEPEVKVLFDAAVDRLRELGATVVEMEWPFEEHLNQYNVDPPDPNDYWRSIGLPESFWVGEDREKMTSYLLLNHIAAYRTSVDYRTIGELVPGGLYYPDLLQSYAIAGTELSLEAGNFSQVLTAMNRWRLEDIEGVMAENDIDFVVYPTSKDPAGDVGVFEQRWNMYTESSDLGMPYVTVPMGYTGDGRPVGLSFMPQKKYDEISLLAYADAFEKSAQARKAPAITPPLPGETIEYNRFTAIPPTKRRETKVPAISVGAKAKATKKDLILTGTAIDASGLSSVSVFINGQKVSASTAKTWNATVPLRRMAKLIPPGATKLEVRVLAKDIHGNASATTKTVKLTKDVQAALYLALR